MALTEDNVLQVAIEQGVIEKVWPKVNPVGHAEELLDYLQQKTS